MGNMSYCMFENTAGDLEDCHEKMGENDFDIEDLSSFEKKAYDKLIELCVDIACDFGDCQQND